MQVRIVSGSTLRVLELEDISQVAVYTDEGDPCSASQEVSKGTIITAHAGEDGFKEQLRSMGILCKTKISGS